MSGSDLAAFIKERQAKQVRALRQAHGIFPRLAIVTNVDNPVINVYMRLKERYGADILIDVEIHRVEPARTLAVIQQLNEREDVQGIIVQLPLADMTAMETVLRAVDPRKDVDGLHPQTTFDAATPMAINWLLAGHGIEMKQKKVAIVGRGRLVGAPLERMWRASNVDVTVFEKGDDLANILNYDIIVTATGVPRVITPEMIAPSAVVVDAGTAAENGEVHGDVSPEVRERQDITITPQKGGVGPLTVTALFDNVITACFRVANNR